jgi:hypothetical protein
VLAASGRSAAEELALATEDHRGTTRQIAVGSALVERAIMTGQRATA